MNQVRLAVLQNNRKYKEEETPEYMAQFWIQVDQERMSQVFLNLISNAVKHTNEEKGEVALTSVLDETENAIVIHFTDNGTGMDSDDLHQIFERFYKGDHPSSGKGESIGLGLAIVNKIIDAHQGEIGVNSKIGKGTTFSIQLPVQKKE